MYYDARCIKLEYQILQYYSMRYDAEVPVLPTTGRMLPIAWRGTGGTGTVVLKISALSIVLLVQRGQ